MNEAKIRLIQSVAQGPESLKDKGRVLKAVLGLDGGPGSGNFNHTGRPGKVGGSGKGEGSNSGGSGSGGKSSGGNSSAGAVSPVQAVTGAVSNAANSYKAAKKAKRQKETRLENQLNEQLKTVRENPNDKGAEKKLNELRKEYSKTRLTPAASFIEASGAGNNEQVRREVLKSLQKKYPGYQWTNAEKIEPGKTNNSNSSTKWQGRKLTEEEERKIREELKKINAKNDLSQYFTQAIYGGGKVDPDARFYGEPQNLLKRKYPLIRGNAKFAENSEQVVPTFNASRYDNVISLPAHKKKIKEMVESTAKTLNNTGTTVADREAAFSFVDVLLPDNARVAIETEDGKKDAFEWDWNNSKYVSSLTGEAIDSEELFHRAAAGALVGFISADGEMTELEGGNYKMSDFGNSNLSKKVLAEKSTSQGIADIAASAKEKLAEATNTPTDRGNVLAKIPIPLDASIAMESGGGYKDSFKRDPDDPYMFVSVATGEKVSPSYLMDVISAGKFVGIIDADGQMHEVEGGHYDMKDFTEQKPKPAEPKGPSKALVKKRLEWSNVRDKGSTEQCVDFFANAKPGTRMGHAEFGLEYIKTKGGKWQRYVFGKKDGEPIDNEEAATAVLRRSVHPKGWNVTGMPSRAKSGTRPIYARSNGTGMLETKEKPKRRKKRKTTGRS